MSPRSWRTPADAPRSRSHRRASPPHGSIRAEPSRAQRPEPPSAFRNNPIIPSSSPLSAAVGPGSPAQCGTGAEAGAHSVPQRLDQRAAPQVRSELRSGGVLSSRMPLSRLSGDPASGPAGVGRDGDPDSVPSAGADLRGLRAGAPPADLSRTKPRNCIEMAPQKP